jgi:transcriptional regulator GlxA family with amidase domain
MRAMRGTPSPTRHDGPTCTIKTVGFLLVPGFSLLAYAAAVEPLRAANRLAGRTLYRWLHVTCDDKPAPASSGAAVVPDMKLGSEPDKLDVLLVCASGNPAEFDDPKTFAWLRKLARSAVIIGGISGGAFVLAKARLLRGRRCTVHWEHVAAFREAFPDVELTRSLFELDRDRITCSGGVAGLDMMVALIAREHGQKLAAAVSDWLLHTQIREGDRPQRMDLRFRSGVRDERLLNVLKTMESSIESPITRDQLAKIAGMSLRQLERAFRSSLGCGMHEHYLQLRLARSRELVRETSLPMVEIAVATGFASSSQFSRAFRRAFGVSPREMSRLRTP